MEPKMIEMLEKAALQRLTEDRLLSGSMGPEMENMLAESGILLGRSGARILQP
jgi:hypothetical protein